MAKKIVTLLLAITLTLSVTACSGKEDTNTSADGNGVQAEEELETSTEESETSGEESTEEESEEEESTDEAEENAGQVEGLDALEAAKEKMASVSNVEGQMVMEMGMKISEEGESDSPEMNMHTTMDMVCFNDPRKIKMVMNMSIPGVGSTEQSIYGEVEEDGTAIMYMYDGTDWTKQVAGTADMEQYYAYNSMLSFISDGQEYTFVGMEEVDGANAYKYSAVMSEEEAREAILSSGGLDAMGLGMDAAQMDSLLEDLGEIVEYVWIDEASLYPVKYETDMTAVMDTLMTSVIASMGEEAEGLSMNITKMTMSMTCFNFNSATDFTIPEEAKQD